MKETYRKKLEKVYELEGLLMLALNKEEMPEGLEALIERKLTELMEQEETELREEEVSHMIESAEETPDDEEDDPIVYEEEEPVYDEEEPDYEEEQRDYEEEQLTYYAIDDDEDEYAEEAPGKKAGPGGRQAGSRKPPVFSLNDRFLFLRELFDGDNSRFNSALTGIASSRDASEATRMLAEEYGIEEERGEHAARFIDIILDYFDSRR